MKTEKEREFTFSATFSLQSLSSDLKVPSITNRFSFDSKSYLVYGMKTYPTCDSPLKAFFTLQRLSSALAQKQYRIGLLFRYKKGDFGTISVTERSCAAPISQVVGKHVHASIPKGNVGYVQYTVPDTVAVEPTFVSFLQHSQTYSVISPVILSNFFEEQ